MTKGSFYKFIQEAGGHRRLLDKEAQRDALRIQSPRQGGARTKLIRSQLVTTAKTHDAVVIEPLLDKEADSGKRLYADAGYTGRIQTRLITSFGMTPEICEKGHRNHPLTEDQKKENRRKSRVRSRIEHVFGFVQVAMGGSFVRTVGMMRAAAHEQVTQLCHNAHRIGVLIAQGVIRQWNPVLLL